MVASAGKTSVDVLEEVVVDVGLIKLRRFERLKLSKNPPLALGLKVVTSKVSSVTPVSVVVVVADEVDTCSAGVAVVVFGTSSGSSYWVSSSMTRLRSASVGGGRVTSPSFPTSFWWLPAVLVVKSGSSVVAKGTVGVMKNDKVVSESSDSSFDDAVVVTTGVSSSNSPPVVVVSK